MAALEKIISDAWEARAELAPGRVERSVKAAIDEAISLLDAGKARVAEPTDTGWQVNEWLKKAVLLSFRINDNAVIEVWRGTFLRQGAAQILQLFRAGFSRLRHASCAQRHGQTRRLRRL